MVQRRGLDVDAHFVAATQLGDREILAEFESIQSAMRRQRKCLHGGLRYIPVLTPNVNMTAIKVPPLGESIVEATVSRWLKKDGDRVAAGDTLVELETDKITVEVPAMSAGVLTKRLHQEGDVVHVNDVLAELDETAGGEGRAAASGETSAPSPVPANVTVPEERLASRASPAAQRVAAEKGIDLTKVQGTGRGGVVSKPDVIEGAPGPAPLAPPAARPSPPAAQSETREKMSTRRRRIAEHLLEAQHATAHLTTFNEIDMSAVSAARERLKERVEKEHGVKLSYLPFFVKAACLALKSYPVVNAQIDGDSIVYKHYVHMGIAVASDAGLVVPTIKDADRKGMVQVARDIGEVAKRARDGKLTMDDLTGGTFTITNGGVFGSLISTPIINSPQVGILGLHKIQDRPMAIAGKVEIRPMMYVALSYDHRIIEGQQAVLFLVRIKELMEDPTAMLID
jgi:2-oxoglutarate dehydrogenase E2 component (dihydrolipoamide succinyltransferase)